MAMILQQLLDEIAAAQQELACLTPREKLALTLVAKGFWLKEVGRHMGVTEETVSNHLCNLRRKLGLNTTASAVLAAKARWA